MVCHMSCMKVRLNTATASFREVFSSSEVEDDEDDAALLLPLLPLSPLSSEVALLLLVLGCALSYSSTYEAQINFKINTELALVFNLRSNESISQCVA